MVQSVLRRNVTRCQALPNILNRKCVIKTCRTELKNVYLQRYLKRTLVGFGSVFLFVHFLSLLFFILTDSWVSLCAVPFLSNHDLTLVSGLSGLSQAQTDGSALDSNADLKINPPKQTSFSQAEPAVSWIRTTAKRFNMCKWLPMIAAVSLTNINMNQLAVDDPWVADWLEICWKCFTTVFCETALPRCVAWPPAGSGMFCLLVLWLWWCGPCFPTLHRSLEHLFYVL